MRTESTLKRMFTGENGGKEETEIKEYLLCESFQWENCKVVCVVIKKKIEMEWFFTFTSSSSSNSSYLAEMHGCCSPQGLNSLKEIIFLITWSSYFHSDCIVANAVLYFLYLTSFSHNISQSVLFLLCYKESRAEIERQMKA